ncbi:hypothetical protein PM8797T_30232 [Gimesia maris DSM 8797]|uniref:DUF5673 domain-containing protein n=2 Tax=Gimesia maris TaxID=122 RepID=A0A3D3R2K0_9PLAN|nr:hypothetical protein PM8797T_30232 [Gimesia maris DSM 8797]MAC53730.1 hypothetical protein [Gimesia sp.]HCO22979.1 hypothetical protein [Gimesia maris]|tara:strand:- start:5199 stop:5846 length:648 start_codon:yes stop_codon:yes gene_type:complete
MSEQTEPDFMQAEINEFPGKWENGKGDYLILIGLVVLQGILALLTSYFFQTSLGDGVIYAGIISGYPLLFWFLFSWIRSLRSCGSTLLDCRGPRFETALILLALLLLPGAVLSFFVSAEHGQGILMGGLLLSTPIMMLITSSGRLLIVENGVWHHGTLFKWDEITGYSWTGAANSQLVLQSSKRFFKGAGPPLSVPPELKAAVNELLQKHIQAGS